jgi:RHS repeat-associated protein
VKEHLNIKRLSLRFGGTIALPAYGPYGYPKIKNLRAKAYINERFDPETGLQYLHARYYDPSLGRFLTPDSWDPILARVDINRYAYAGDDPINGSDPAGHDWRDVYNGLGLAANGVTYNAPPAPPFSQTPLGRYGPIVADIGADFAPFWGDFKGYLEAETPLDYAIATVSLLPGLDVFKLGKRLPSTAGRLANELGARFEGAVLKRYDSGDKRNYRINGNERVADGVNPAKRTITEAKYVQRQGYTRQLKDMVAYAKKEGLQPRLVVPRGTYLSRDLLRAAMRGEITIIRTGMRSGRQ